MVVGVVVLVALVPGVGGKGSGLDKGKGGWASGSVGLVGWLELFGAPAPPGGGAFPVVGVVVAEPVPWPGACGGWKGKKGRAMERWFVCSFRWYRTEDGLYHPRVE